MGYSINRIPESNVNFYSSIGDLWKSSTGETPTFSADESKHAREGSLVWSVDEGYVFAFNWDYDSSTAIRNSIVTTEDDIGDYVESFLWVKSQVSMTVSIETILTHNITLDPIVTLEYRSEANSVRLTSGEWYLLRANPIQIPDDIHKYSISLEITTTEMSSGSHNLYISHPATYCQNDFIRNTAWFDTWFRMPVVMKESDSRLTKPSYSLSRFIELCCEHRGEIYDILDEINYVDISDGYDSADNLTKSVMVDPDVIARKYAFWVAQFVGTRLYSPTVSVTPWQNIPTTWQGIDEIDTVVDVNDTVGWNALQSFKPELIGLDDYFRWQISTGYYGINAGSLQAVTESIKRILTGTKSVRVEANPSSWAVNVYTYKSETLGTDLLGTGDEVEASQIILKRCKPAGFFVRHYLESTETP